MTPADIDALEAGVRSQDRGAIGRSITLVESKNAIHRRSANDLLTRLAPHAGWAYRLGVTGVPGVGKSTFIEALGTKLIDEGHRVAVLAVDPSSSRTGGSILADKTRMIELANAPEAFVRPSPTAGTLGGVTQTTRETMIVLEAAGFDVMIVETVGVGQSETMVVQMVDFFLVLMLAGAGDQFQAIKKGVVELADMIAVNKADGDNVRRAKSAAAEYRHVMNILTPRHEGWRPPVLTVSAIERTGLDELWTAIEEHRTTLMASGAFDEQRRSQRLSWFRSAVEQRAVELVWRDVAAKRDAIEREVVEGRLTTVAAVDALFEDR